MATKQEKEELVEALKFTPREITITLWGYGGEIVMGRVSREAYKWWTRNAEEAAVELSDFVFNWGFEEENEDKEIPDEARFITAGEWHECDGIAHESGVELSDICGMTVTDDLTGDQIFECNLGLAALESHGIDTACLYDLETGDAGPGNACFVGQSIEKGTFFEGRILIRQPFDPRRIQLAYNNIAGWCLVSGLTYDGEDVEGTDAYDTRGKGMECDLTYIGGDPESDPYDENTVWPDSWITEWREATVAPERDGLYQVEVGEWNWRRIWWINEAWRDDHGVPVEGVSRWRGLDREIL
jgi:hypothetical protein